MNQTHLNQIYLIRQVLTRENIINPESIDPDLEKEVGIVQHLQKRSTSVLDRGRKMDQKGIRLMRKGEFMNCHSLHGITCLLYQVTA